MEDEKKDNKAVPCAKNESDKNQKLSGNFKDASQTNLSLLPAEKFSIANAGSHNKKREGEHGVDNNAKEDVAFNRKLNMLQEKTKTLRRKLSRGFGSKRINQHEELVAKSEKAQEENDALAAHFMNKIASSTISTKSRTEIKTSALANTPNEIITKQKIRYDSKKCSAESLKNLPPLHFNKKQITPGSEKPKNKTEKRPTRRELEEQLENVRELLLRLALENPQLETTLRQLIKDKRFAPLNIFNSLPKSEERICAQTSNGGIASNKNQQSKIKPLGKQRQDSLTSNTSSVSSGAQNNEGPSTSKKAEITQSDEESDKKRNSRTRRGKRGKNSKKKTQQSEQEALKKYLKMIVEEYLGSKDSDKVAEYIYKPDIESLEMFARRLTNAGMGYIVEEEIRINRKNNRQSFVIISSDREDMKRDAIILLPVARKYAFEGDTVRAFVMNPLTSASNSETEDKTKKETVHSEGVTEDEKNHSFSEEEDPFVGNESLEFDVNPNELDSSLVNVSESSPKAFVIQIIKQTEKREIVGTICFKNTIKLNGAYFYKLRPHDMRMPMVFVPTASVGEIVTPEQKSDIGDFLYVAKLREINAHGICIGDLHQPVGKVGNIEAEIKAILLHNKLKDLRPYEERFNQLFAQPDPPISDKDLNHRVDLRKRCIFTIDPLTARDLDDAVSVETINDGLYEVGVHISDVAYYLQEDTELDNIVKKRATSVYLVNEVIHMLPQPLCFKCSLLPGEDKFAFSVFWQINPDGEIIDPPRFTRSIINSCTQFAYEHAQKIIDNPTEEFDEHELPTIHNGFNAADIISRVRVLKKIATNLRAKRFDGGALSLNNAKLHFSIDPQTGDPTSYDVEERQEANFLIEEFMLLANQSVARFIYSHFPKIAILRHHPPPLTKSLKSLKEKLCNFGIELDYTSSKSLYESIKKACSNAADPKAMDVALNTLLTKPMARAQYFCSDGKTEGADLWHYALAIPIYTHFTSPIRRYPDILVHRLLAACLNYTPPPKRRPEELQCIAKVCNEQKLNAKNAGDELSNLFFKRYIKSKRSIIMNAVVIEVFRYMANVVTIDTGHNILIEYKAQKLIIDNSKAPEYILVSEENSEFAPIPLRPFSTVEIRVVVRDGKLSGYFVLPDPKQRLLNSSESSTQQCQINSTFGGNEMNGNTYEKVPQRTRHRSLKENVENEEEDNSGC